MSHYDDKFKGECSNCREQKTIDPFVIQDFDSMTRNDVCEDCLVEIWSDKAKQYGNYAGFGG